MVSRWTDSWNNKKLGLLPIPVAPSCSQGYHRSEGLSLDVTSSECISLTMLADILSSLFFISGRFSFPSEDFITTLAMYSLMVCGLSPPLGDELCDNICILNT